jgi:RNA polymerase sigma-70 factor (ECF subfamily)
MTGERPRLDARLIERAGSGDRAAQEELWRAHRRWVAAIVLAHRPHEADVEDLVQDVAVKFVSRLHTLREPAAFRPWLRQIVLNICRGAARSIRPELHFADPAGGGEGAARRDGLVEEPAATAGDSPRILLTRDFAARLLDHALTLPSEYREPLLLRCLRSMTYQQIGDLLNLPVTTVETRLARARRMLREELAHDTDPRTGAASTSASTSTSGGSPAAQEERG